MQKRILFFYFVELLSDFGDQICQQLNTTVLSVGIRSTISQMAQLLGRHEENLLRYL